MTDTELNEIEARCNAATPGPWRWRGNSSGHVLYLASISGRFGWDTVMDFVRWGMGRAQPRFSVDGRMAKSADLIRHEVEYRKDIIDVNHPDAAFITHSRTDVPRLIAEVRSLQRQVSERDDAVNTLTAELDAANQHVKIVNENRQADIDAAVKAEREACAEIAFNFEVSRSDDGRQTACEISATIRARGARGGRMKSADIPTLYALCIERAARVYANLKEKESR